MKNISSKELFDTLKQMLKFKDINYKELSEKISMTESGVKKIMIQEDCNLSKILQICESCDINFVELIEIASQNIEKIYTLNSIQEDAFLNNISLYFFFKALLHFNYNIENVKTHFNLDKQTSLKYMLKLDKIKLIELLENNKIKPCIPQHYEIKKSAKLSRISMNTVHRNFFEFSTSKLMHTIETEEFAGFSDFKLKSETALELKQELKNIHKKYIKRSTREQLNHSDNELISISALTYLIKDFNHLHNIKL